ncbi:glyoxylate reductase/hydroxypyruvate reductase-like isoform X2 [Littorina saxatilis]|uniref:Glyoxylate reductase/hydroxypyruvate reductase n=1 Tax=Littorina saxatilis TaxID=31220 RepID=A0AAN9AWC5_9CAEN
MSVQAYITRQIPEEGMSILKKKLNVSSWCSENVMPREDLLKHVKGMNGILCTISDNMDKEVLDAAGPQLKVISTLSVGTGHIDVSECKKRGIEVLNTPDVASDSAAEFTVTLVLLVARRLLEGMDAVKNGEWGLWKPMWICGFEMGGRTLGIHGLGRVGFGIARRLKPFNIERIIYHDLYHKEYASSVGATLVDLPTLLAESDMLCICCAPTPQTIKSFNKEAFAKMKEGSILINTSRGVIVDHNDLDAALKAGRPMAAGLDVTDPEPLPIDHPLMKNPKCIITPHQGTSTWATRINMAKAAASNLYISLLGH